MHDNAHRRVQRDGARARNGVAHLDEFHLKSAQSDRIARLNYIQRHVGDAVFLELMVEQRQRELRAIHRSDDAVERIGRSADMVLMPVGDHKAADAIRIFF